MQNQRKRIKRQAIIAVGELVASTNKATNIILRKATIKIEYNTVNFKVQNKFQISKPI